MKERIKEALEMYHSSSNECFKLLRETITESKDGILPIDDFDFPIVVKTDNGSELIYPIRLISQKNPHGYGYYVTDSDGISYPLYEVIEEDQISLLNFIANR